MSLSASASASASPSSPETGDDILEPSPVPPSVPEVPPIWISDAMDGGNIEFLECQLLETNQETDHDDDDTLVHWLVRLNIRPDPFTELEQTQHFQYFCFQSTLLSNNVGKVRVTYSIDNAGQAAYWQAWDGSTVCVTSEFHNPLSWKRNLSTQYLPETGQLQWTHEYDNAGDAADQTLYFSYFPPFTYQQHLTLIRKCQQAANSNDLPYDVEVQSLGHSLQGRAMECVRVGSGPAVVWLIHRQHPGEHMAEYYAEGLLTRLLGLDNAAHDVDGLVHDLCRNYTFYILPNMNPDGAVAGYLRTNAAGANLNREWANAEQVIDEQGTSRVVYEAPTWERSPEVACVLQKMDEVGKCHVFLDVHGDEGLPFNFLAVSVCPNWAPQRQALHGAFGAAYRRANPDMQSTIGYPAVLYHPQRKTLNKAANQMGFRFAHNACLAMTLEMPFKDCWTNPDPERGWTPARARQLGASVLDPLAYLYPYLQLEEDVAEHPNEKWKTLPPEDAFIAPTWRYSMI